MKVALVLLVSLSAALAYPQFGGFGRNLNNFGTNLIGNALNTFGLNSGGNAASSNTRNNPNVPYITRYENNPNDERGNYRFLAEGSDGQIREEIGGLKNKGTDQEALVMGGWYSYTGPDGKQYSVSYVADENGFQPSGDHLPPSAGVKRRTNNLGIPSSAVASLAGGGLGK